MRISIPQWQGRISPVFDVAVSFLLIDVEGWHEVRREERRLSGTASLARIAEFLSFGANTLICGAISAPVEVQLVASGVQVFSFTCGTVDDVLAAYLNGELSDRWFAMPGCQRRRRQRGENIMPIGSGAGAGSSGAGRGQGRGQGQCRPQGGAGRMGGPITAGPCGSCVCPSCGEKASHTAGKPCLQMSCPECGTPMTRS
jgi:predicted Fe-Mo cluster-binding NifX family protein